MLQHGTGGLRTAAAESVIELVDGLGVRASLTGKDYAAPVPVDRVHYAEHTCRFFHPV
jgi:hypothetical protein